MDFAFGFESYVDLGYLLANAASYFRNRDNTLRVQSVTADVVRVRSDLTLEGLRDLLRTVPDGETMVNTVAFAEDFYAATDFDVHAEQA
jgi:hypothetical protein